ncbi:hypothetical protein FRC20_001712 [Serendipita sp. 405]|nr:hypothetical protein FRC15_004988 [Serendipita sp. 397]KAG8851590.1 hypothetical protein FRC20_001712 [Serendipita sp. 405]
MDECPYGGCNYGDLDMSEGLFTFFAPTSAGVFYMEWEFDGEGGSGGYTPPAPAYTPPAPAYTPPVETSSSVYVPPPSSSSSAPTPSSSSSSSDSASTTASTDDTVSAQGVENASDAPGSGGHAIDSANRAAQQLAKFIYAAGHF